MTGLESCKTLIQRAESAVTRDEAVDRTQWFCEAAEAVVGAGWKSKLARIIRVERRTVQRWTNGETGVPEPIIALMECLLQMDRLGLPAPNRWSRDG